MNIQGCDCSIVIKTTHREMGVPYAEETIREAVSLLQEEAAIEGDGVCRAIKQNNGVTGCIVTPLTLGSGPLLLYLAMGSSGHPVYVSETRNLYVNMLNLMPLEDGIRFDLVQARTVSNEQLASNQRFVSNERLLFEGCGVKSFELRFMRGENVKLKLDICGERTPVVFPYTDIPKTESGERFHGDNVTYRINDKDFTNIYGLTLVSKKEGGTKTELWIKRALDNAAEIPEIIDELVITAQLLRDKYPNSASMPQYSRHFGRFVITIKRLVLVADETDVNSPDAVIGPLRFYVAGTVKADVFSFGEETFE